MPSFTQNQELYNAQGSLFQTPLSNVDRLILRNGIRFYTINSFDIPYPVTYKYFKHYKKLYWSASYLLSQIEAGMIVRDDIAFIVQYHKSLTRGMILNEAKKNENTQFILSFRAPQDQWNIDPIVLISNCERN